MPPKDDSGQYVPPYEGIREENLIYVHYQDDPWTAVNDVGFREFYDLNTDPYELRNLAYYGEVPQATLDRLEGRLLRLRGCKAEGCRAAEDDTTPPPPPPPDPGPGPPSVVSTSPTANATGVAPTANVTATFSENMMASSINGQTFKLFKKGTTTKIAAAVSYQASTDMATLDPTNSLQAGVTYKAVVTTGAKDLAGIPLDQNSTTSGNQQKVWTFTTGTR